MCFILIEDRNLMGICYVLEFVVRSEQIFSNHHCNLLLFKNVLMNCGCFKMCAILYGNLRISDNHVLLHTDLYIYSLLHT